MLLSVFRLSPLSFSFLAGILVSVATNLYTSVLLDRTRSARPLLYAAVVLLAVAGIALIATSMTLDDLRSRPGGHVDSQLRTYRRRLMTLASVTILGMAGAFLLLFVATRP